MNDVAMIVNSRGSFEWKLQKLCDVIDALVEQAAQGNTRNIASIVSACGELNRMQGHHSAVTTLNVNLDQDTYMAKLNEITMQLIKEKREAKLIECKRDN